MRNKDTINIDIKHYIRVLEDYQWALKELYESRIEMEDIAKEFQPVRSVPTDRQILENFRMSNEDMILDKMFREEKATKKQKKAMSAIDEANMILEYVIDSIEKEMIKDLYMTKGFSKRDFCNKYSYDNNSVSNKIKWIIKKAVRRKRKLT